MDLLIRGNRIVTPEGIRPASIAIAEGRIVEVGAFDQSASGDNVIDAGDLVVMPGIVDTHVHVNEPGRSDWEGFATATAAAARGGVTTILDMPLNSIPPTTTVAGLEAKQAAARGKCSVNVEFIGGVVPGNADDLAPLAARGVRAFKCFLTPSGVDEFPNVTEADLRIVFPILASVELPLMVHAEDPAYLNAAIGSSRKYADYLASRPAEAEHAAIEMLIRLMEWCPTPVHIVHLSSAGSLGVIAAARERGLPITVETCPHYLTFNAEAIPDGATEFKCAPPVRDSVERDGLWDALIAGAIDLVASDHSPCPPSMKQTEGDFFAAWGGIASLQLSLPAVWTEARMRGVQIDRIVEWMSAAPARLAGMADNKGAIAAGYDADIVLWNPDASFRVREESLLHRHKVTPYLGRELFGTVSATYVGGRCVFSDIRRIT